MTYSPQYLLSSIIKRSGGHASVFDKQRFFNNASSSTASDLSSNESQVTAMISSRHSGVSFQRDNLKRHLDQKIRELFLPHQPYEQHDHAFEFQQSLERCKSPQIETTFQLPSLHAVTPIVTQRTKDLYRLFLWIVQNVQPSYHHAKTKKKKQQNLKTMNELEQEAVDTMISSERHESAKQVLDMKSCVSSFGMAHLLAVMAQAAGIQDIHVIYGYLKAPKDTIIENNEPVPINHAWCSVKIDKEYRIIDCWLASPHYPQNNNEIDLHWFLTHPNNTKLTHLTKHDSPLTFFQSPYVRHAYFKYPLRLINCQTVTFTEDEMFYLSFSHKPNTRLYAETESKQGIVTPALTQCQIDNPHIYTVKAVLPPLDKSGWLKLYVVDHETYLLLMCFHLTQHAVQPRAPFEFVQLNVRYQLEFYVQEPQCYFFYPFQTYYFNIKSKKTGYHKLAVQSPSGKLMKLMTNPQEQSYDGNITITEVGPWALLYVVNRTKTVLANWYCPPSNVE